MLENHVLDFGYNHFPDFGLPPINVPIHNFEAHEPSRQLSEESFVPLLEANQPEKRSFDKWIKLFDKTQVEIFDDQWRS